MQYQWLNDGQAFPAGHRRAGEFGVAVDFEDGRPEAQNIYLPEKVGDGALVKLLKMYASTQIRNAELMGDQSYGRRTEPAAPAAAAAAAAPTGPTAIERRIQNVADLEDPAKAPGAIVNLLKDATGVDIVQDTHARRAREVVAAFMRNNPDYPATPGNARLLRDRVFASLEGKALVLANVEDYQKAYDELTDSGVLESTATQETTPASQTEEPPAPRRSSSRGSTGARPSTLHGGMRPAPSGPGLTLQEVLDAAGTDEYVERRRTDPIYRAAVDRVLEQNGY